MKPFSTFFALALFSTALGTFASPAVASTSKVSKQSSTFDYTLYEELLRSHMIPREHLNLVHYPKLKLNIHTLKKHNQTVSSVSKKQFDNWKRDEQMAFIINAYNSLTLELIVDNYPLDSIKDIGGWFQNPWKIKFFSFLGKKRHLDYLEHDLLRPTYKDPRIHFAVNCASLGCPPLATEPYRGTTLDSQLDEAAKAFLTANSFNSYNKEKNLLELSSIFKWYGEDFGSKDELKRYLAPIMLGPNASQKLLTRFQKAKIDYKSYDWKLNNYSEAKNQSANE